jgi:phosphatidate cytidylyltransferase
MSPPWIRITIGTGLVAGCAVVLGVDVPLALWVDAPIAPGFWLLMLLSFWVGCWEFIRMLRAKGHPVSAPIVLVFTTLLVASAWLEIYKPLSIPYWMYRSGLEPSLVVLIAMVFTAFIVEIVGVERGRRGSLERALAGVGWTALVVLTVGMLGIFLAKVRFFFLLDPEHGDPGSGLLCLALTVGVVKGADIGAYAIGSALGRHKLVPTLSPNKTVEGLVGALAVGTVMALGIGSGIGGFEWPAMLIFGLVVSVAGVLGDLAESLMKRACGVKDTGRIPGFGGVLDILDSLLAAGPVAYVALVVLTRTGMIR